MQYFKAKTIYFSVKKRSGQRFTGNVAHLQAHEAGETSECRPRTHAPTQVPTRYICVSL